jgi:hypothetical protein
MQDQTRQLASDSDHQIERAIVSQTLRDDHDSSWSRAELEIELDGIDALAVGDAIARLADQGVIELAGEIVRASRATVRLDELDMIAV